MEFAAVLKKREGIDGAYIEIPFDVPQVFGAKRVKVLATFDGEPYRGSIVTMKGLTFLGVTREIRDRIGKQPGDEVWVTVEKDEAERKVDLPEDFGALLQQRPDALAIYEKLSYTHKKEYMQWLNSAKTAATREKRMQTALEMLLEKQ